MGTQPYHAWKIIAKVQKGLSHHHQAPASKTLRRVDGSLTTTNREYVDTLSDHFSITFSRIDVVFDLTVLYLTPGCTVHTKLDALPFLKELRYTFQHLRNHKSPGPNNLTTDALKVLSATLPEDAPPSHPIHLLLSILQNVWTGEDAPTEWETGTFCSIFKMGDTTSPGNWHPVVLLDVTYKIMAAIIARRMSKVLKKEGLEEQYGNKGCADAVTALKIAL